MIKVHKPAKIYLGLDFFQFDISSAKGKREGFSQQRLDRVSSSFFSYLLSKLEETAGMKALAKKTVIESRLNSKGQLFTDGWDIKRGNTMRWDEKAWINSLVSFLKTYDSFVLAEKSFDDLSKFVELCRDVNIDLKVFFNPVSVDLLALIWFSGRYELFEEVKQRVAKIIPFFDFATVNEISLDNDHFYDASHYNHTTGEKLILALAAKEDVRGKIIEAHSIAEWLETSKAILQEQMEGKGFSSLKKTFDAYHLGQNKQVYRDFQEYVKKK